MKSAGHRRHSTERALRLREKKHLARVRKEERRLAKRAEKQREAQ